MDEIPAATITNDAHENINMLSIINNDIDSTNSSNSEQDEIPPEKMNSIESSSNINNNNDLYDLIPPSESVIITDSDSTYIITDSDNQVVNDVEVCEEIILSNNDNNTTNHTRDTNHSNNSNYTSSETKDEVSEMPITISTKMAPFNSILPTSTMSRKDDSWLRPTRERHRSSAIIQAQNQIKARYYLMKEINSWYINEPVVVIKPYMPGKSSVMRLFPNVEDENITTSSSILEI